ncbi:hypothetical protein ILUMI_16777, partial [Ignelater luminosus]
MHKELTTRSPPRNNEDGEDGQKNIMVEHTESNDADIELEEEVGNTYSLHDSDASVGTKVFSDSDEEDLCALTLDPTKVSQIKSNDFLL